MNHSNKSTFWAGAPWAGISDTNNKTIMAALSKMLKNPLVKKKLLKVPLSSRSSTFRVIAGALEKPPRGVVGMLRHQGMKNWGFLLPSLLLGLEFCHGRCKLLFFHRKMSSLVKDPLGQLWPGREQLSRAQTLGTVSSWL